MLPGFALAIVRSSCTAPLASAKRNVSALRVLLRSPQGSGSSTEHSSGGGDGSDFARASADADAPNAQPGAGAMHAAMRRTWRRGRFQITDFPLPAAAAAGPDEAATAPGAAAGAPPASLPEGGGGAAVSLRGGATSAPLPEAAAEAAPACVSGGGDNREQPHQAQQQQQQQQQLRKSRSSTVLFRKCVRHSASLPEAPAGLAFRVCDCSGEVTKCALRVLSLLLLPSQGSFPRGHHAHGD